MKKGTWLHGLAVLLSVLAVVFFLAGPVGADSKAKKEKNSEYIVNIKGGQAGGSGGKFNESNVTIEPEKLRIPEGAKVEFVNWAKGIDIKISFKEKKYNEFLSNPKGYKVDPKKGYYATEFTPLGEKASIVFMKKGTYEYKVHFRNVLKTWLGQIIVH